jgi:beta-glucosidase
VEISALLRPRQRGTWTFGVGGFGRMSLTVDGRTVLDGVFPRETDDPAVVHVNPPVREVSVELASKRPVRVVARRELAEDSGRATVVTAAPPRPDARGAVAAAVRAARETDAAIVFVGTTEHDETEGQDREELSLGGCQDDLVRAVAAVNPRTVVVVNSGGPVEMPWREEVGALLLAWFPGQEAGAGIADVLFGLREPGGRLPTTWGARLADTPVTRTRPEAGGLDYAEGLHFGHRAWLRAHRAPAYWFGHGLGYTSWEYEAVEAPAKVGEGEAFTLRVRLRNTGTRAGREVVQVYAARPESAVERPVRWFAGYAAVRADAGRTVTAEVEVAPRVLRHWSQEERAWSTEPGPYRLMVGRSAGDPRWEGEVTVERREVTG